MDSTRSHGRLNDGDENEDKDVNDGRTPQPPDSGFEGDTGLDDSEDGSEDGDGSDQDREGGRSAPDALPARTARGGPDRRVSGPARGAGSGRFGALLALDDDGGGSDEGDEGDSSD